jgi:hypothetical protein
METPKATSNEILKAGTGNMLSLSNAIRVFQDKGYKENLVPRYDHLGCHSEEIKLFPMDIVIDEIVRFENTSDPDDQSILYAISSLDKSVKGLYVESYGLYHDDLSPEMLRRIRDARAEDIARN